MKKLIIALIIIFIGFGAKSQQVPLSEDRRTSVDTEGDVSGSYEKLFNGKNLDGWQVKAQKKDRDKTFWTVEDGAILCNSLGSKDHGYIWLQSEEEYGDFEMRLKFKVSHENLV